MSAVSKEKPTTVRLPRDLRQALAREACRQKRSQSFVIEQAITRYLQAVQVPMDTELQPKPSMDMQDEARLATDAKVGHITGIGRALDTTSVDERLGWLKALAGTGAKFSEPRSAQEIDDFIREIRGAR